MKPEISIIMAGLREQKWRTVYDSILAATKRTFELVIVSPHKTLPDSLSSFKNIKHLQDFGGPMRAAQLAAILAEGRLLFVLMADDGVYLPGGIDKCVDALYAMGEDPLNVAVGRYFEGEAGTKKVFQHAEYYLINYHDATRAPVPDTYLGLNNGVLYRTFWEALGGWDCRYEAAPMGLADFAIRAQRAGGNFTIIDEAVADYDWFPQPEGGDHGPIFQAQVYHDQPLYKQMYAENRVQNQIYINNWKLADSVWARRFK